VGNGDTTKTDLTSVAVRTTLAAECHKLVSTTFAGSYIAGAARAFDGLVLDFEPSGLDAARFDALVALTDAIRPALTVQQHVGHAAHQLGDASAYKWAAPLYARMAGHADFLVDMAYDTGLTGAADYQRFVHDQVISTLAAVDAGPPVAGFRLFLAVPAYPAGKYHDRSVENVGVALAGAIAALTELDKTLAPSAGWFRGIATFLHTDGSGNDGYAGWSTDWATIAHVWLGSP